MPVPLSPLSFLLRSASVWRDRPAVRDGERTLTYAELLAEVEAVAGGLAAAGVGPGDRVAVMLPNVTELLALHYAVPGLGAVIVPLNTRLAAGELGWIVGHCGARVLVAADPALAERAVADLDDPPRILTRDALRGERRPLRRPDDELQLLSINYTSGTTGRPKGVMYTHRGAYLHALGVVVESRLQTRSVYLWTLPMFHCNGWAYTWAVTAAGALHVCLEAVEPDRVWALLRGEGVTNLCAAPTVLTMMMESPRAAPLERPVSVFVGGAPPSPALLERAEGLGLDVTHLYGLTETYGPIAVCAWQPSWDDEDAPAQAALRARQGVGTIVSEGLRVVDDELRDVPADGETLGEVVMRGDNVTIGYYRAPEETARAFSGEWFHSGDLGVMHPDGYVELRDRAKDIVISGGENIATVEVENALASHPAVVEVAVIGVPDERWGEALKAFVVAREPVAEQALQDWVRERLAGFKVPRRFAFRDDLPRTATGKIQKYALRAAEREG
jgi:fatty-acyl-CoA synthase